MGQDHEIILMNMTWKYTTPAHSSSFSGFFKIINLITVGKNVGVGNKMGTDEIDERGRVTIPKELRDKMGLKPKARVRITAGKNGVKIEKAIDLSEFMTELRGCITIKGEIDPLRLKEIWRTVP